MDKEYFTIPDKWFIRGSDTQAQEIKELFKKYYKIYDKHFTYHTTGYYISNNNIDASTVEYLELNSYTEINLEQLKIILNKMNEKEIIGYKFIKTEYAESAELIIGKHGYSKFTRHEDYKEKNILSVYGWGKSIKLLDEAGVLGLWFEPVYKEEKQLPVIDGMQGTYKNDIVTYGCQSFTASLIKVINDIESINSLTISGRLVTKEQINQIVEFIK